MSRGEDFKQNKASLLTFSLKYDKTICLVLFTNKGAEDD